MTNVYSDAQLEAYLDEALPAEQMVDVETALRDDTTLADRLAIIAGRRDAGIHSVGAIWRRHRLTCPPREHLGSYQLGVLEADAADYMRFHLEVVGCRLCNASMEDLRTQHAAEDAATGSRRQKYFQSSAGYLAEED